ncbi:MAG: peptide chain release factor 1 [Candidatus Omnitrophica bacterium]|nr:peptide chain release factor 1 [Candidatus Omnitrophota bacterium]
MNLPRDQFLAHLEELDDRYTQLEEQVASHASRPDAAEYQRLSKELAGLKETVLTFRTYQRIERDAQEAEQLVHAQGDPELRELAREEAVSLRLHQTRLLEQLEQLWREEHEAAERPILVEIRAGTGGLEAGLFVGDLSRMYTKYAAKFHLSVEVMDSHPTEAGGFKDLILSVKGPGAFERFKFESGVHRVQRVPQTEAQGRIHTSTVTVVVLPEPEEVELPPIPSKDLQIDVFRSSGPGGQSVNTTDSAVRIRHLPSGLMVTCQDERSQLRNKEKAMRVLRARLLDLKRQTQQAQIASSRRRQVKSAERSEKIRTYNFPDRRITDHRIGLTLHKLDVVLEGNLQELVDALAAADRTKSLQSASS